MDRVETFMKSTLDDRLYRYVRLPNMLRCLLISDMKSDQATAALDVRVGSLADPQDFPGLAHLCEHMVLQSTRRHRREDQCATFIKKCGGQKKAATTAIDTCYFISVPKGDFEAALERFADCFREPLFEPDAISREIHSVDSEYKKNLASDHCRRRQVVLSLANPASRLARFAAGSRDSLKKSGLREALMEFCSKNYSANVMTLVLVAPMSLDMLEKLAADQFGLLSDKHAMQQDYSLPAAFDPGRLPKLCKIVPLNSKHMLRVSWVLPDTRAMYKSKPAQYIVSLLGNAGPHSLLSYLVDERLAVSLESVLDSKSGNTDLLTASIELTNEGLLHYERVLEIVAAYVGTLRQKGPQQHVFDEQARMQKLAFEYKGPENALYEAPNLASTLHDYDQDHVQDLLFSPLVVTEFDPEAIRKLLNLMVPTNMCVCLSSRTYETAALLVEPWYHAAYSVSDIDAALLDRLKAPQVGPSRHGKVLDYPPVNPLLPKQLSLLPLATSSPIVPQLICDSPGLRVWYKPNSRFPVPKACGYCRVWTDAANFPTSPETLELCRLWVNMVLAEIREAAFVAAQAGMACTLELACFQFTLSFSGFSDSLPILIQQFVEQVRAFRPEQSRELFEDKLIQSLTNTQSKLLETPYSQALDNFTCGLVSFGLNREQKLQLLKTLNFEKFLHFTQCWLRNCQFDWYITGNLSAVFPFALFLFAFYSLMKSIMQLILPFSWLLKA